MIFCTFSKYFTFIFPKLLPFRWCCKPAVASFSDFCDVRTWIVPYSYNWRQFDDICSWNWMKFALSNGLFLTKEEIAFMDWILTVLLFVYNNQTSLVRIVWVPLGTSYPLGSLLTVDGFEMEFICLILKFVLLKVRSPLCFAWWSYLDGCTIIYLIASLLAGCLLLCWLVACCSVSLLIA